MDSRKRTSYLLLIIGILVLALAGSIGYIIGDLNSKSKANLPISSNDEVMQEIDELKAMYDSKIAEKTNSFKVYKEQKAKIQSLMYELEKSKGDAQAMIKYKTQYQELESKMKTLVSEIVVLKTGKTKAVSKVKTTLLNDNTPTTKSNVFTQKEAPKSKPKEALAKKEASKVNVTPELPQPKETIVVTTEKAQPKEVIKEDFKLSNLKVLTYQLKSSGKQEETESANKAKLMKISFSVSGIKSQSKTYYIQIINSKNNVMGKKITEYFGDKSLTYSFSKSVDFDDDMLTVSQEVYDANFEKGTYFINIFDQSKLVGNSSITLK